MHVYNAFVKMQLHGVWYTAESKLRGELYTGEFIVKPMKAATALKATILQKPDHRCTFLSNSTRNYLCFSAVPTIWYNAESSFCNAWYIAELRFHYIWYTAEVTFLSITSWKYANKKIYLMRPVEFPWWKNQKSKISWHCLFKRCLNPTVFVNCNWNSDAVIYGGGLL